MRCLVLVMMGVALGGQPKQLAMAKPEQSGKVCAILLLNARKDDQVDRMSVKPPEGKFFLRQVIPPAPACENWGK